MHEALPAAIRRGYTTTLKVMQVMTEKGLVGRDESCRSHVYRARVGEEETQGRLLGELMSKAFGGSAAKLVLQALSQKPASPEELAEIRRLLDEMEDTGAAGARARGGER